MGGGHRTEDDLSSRQWVFQFRMNLNPLGQFRAEKIRFIFALAADRFGESGVVCPQRNFLRRAAARKNDRQRRAPAPRAENGDLRHFASFFLPKEKRGSVPSTRRWRLPSCL